MKQIIIIKHGAEYVCLQSDAGNCEPACPNLVTTEGFLIKEAIQLSRPTTNRVCALKSNIDIEKTRNENTANANLIISAVNACISINPDNPQVVAESIKDMYEALSAIMRWKKMQGTYDDAIQLVEQTINKIEGR